MGSTSKIEWTDATWNPVTGCTKVSQGCKYCYAERLTERLGKQKFTDVVLHPDRLELPLHWRTPRRIFVNSMSDLFHEQVPEEFIDRVFAVMALSPQHTFQVLTKRAERMRAYLFDPYRTDWIDEALPPATACHANLDDVARWPLPNVWLGVSAEDQKTADARIPILLQTPAAVRFVSLEPLLGPISLRPWLGCALCGQAGPLVCCQTPGGLPLCDSCAMNVDGPVMSPSGPRLSWCIVGGESGGPPERALVEPNLVEVWSRGKRVLRRSGWRPKPIAVEWIRAIRDQCVAAGVSFLLKQWGGPTPKSGGRLLDGRTWEEYPT